MKRIKLNVPIVAVVLFTLLPNAGAQDRGSQTRGNRKTTTTKSPLKKTEPAADQQPVANEPSSPVSGSEDDQLKAIVGLPPAERIDRLQAFVETNPNSPLKVRAAELLVSARAALGDEKLRGGDTAGGIEQFRTAVSAAPSDMSDKLYYEVVSQIPLNLYLRGERAAALESAHMVEALVRVNPARVLALGSFFLRVEEPAEAVRLAEFVIKLSPDSSAAHEMLGTAQHMSFRFDEAMAEFSRALELDPKSLTARGSLADLKRAAGRAEEALSLYREQLQQDPKNKAARAGVVLALLDLGKSREAETELNSALTESPDNLPLMAGASYWYAAHNDPSSAAELARRAIDREPRYTWAYIAMARAMEGAGKPQNVDGLPYYARRFGNFPTLDYELATALSASGLYEEAATALVRSFALNGDQIETRLANRVPASASNFIELLAPERRASIFQPVAADSEANARMLKGLLAFGIALGDGGGNSGSANEAAAVRAAREFVGSADSMQTYRQIYAADKLIRRGVGLNAAVALLQSAPAGVETALDVPTSTMAIVADEVRDLRLRAIEVGGTANIPEIARNTRSAILRGRIEDNLGFAFYAQGNMGEALTHYRRAVSVLPYSTPWGRTAIWHLGDALRSSGHDQEALSNYLKAYNPAAPDLVKRAVIQALYKKVNGTLDGLDEKIGAAASASTSGDLNVPAQSPEPPAAAAATETTGSSQTSGQSPARLEPVDSPASDRSKSSTTGDTSVAPNVPLSPPADSNDSGNKSGTSSVPSAETPAAKPDDNAAPPLAGQSLPKQTSTSLQDRFTRPGTRRKAVSGAGSTSASGNGATPVPETNTTTVSGNDTSNVSGTGNANGSPQRSSPVQEAPTTDTLRPLADSTSGNTGTPPDQPKKDKPGSDSPEPGAEQPKTDPAKSSPEADQPKSESDKPSPAVDQSKSDSSATSQAGDKPKADSPNPNETKAPETRKRRVTRRN
jgi:tetratricopeptide (TPR) repeat protein